MTLYLARARGLYNSAESFSFGYKFNSTALIGTVASTFTSAVTTFWTTATNGYANYAFTDVALVDTVIYELNVDELTVDKTVTANAHAGTSGTSSLPYGTSPYVRMLGAEDTRSDQGGFALPTPVQSALGLGLWTSAFTASMKLVLDPFFTSMRGLAGYSAVKTNRRVNKQGDAPHTQHIVTSYSLSNKPGTRKQRTRKQKATAFVTGTV